jgi:hypothetical protein
MLTRKFYKILHGAVREQSSNFFWIKKPFHDICFVEKQEKSRISSWFEHKIIEPLLS